MPTNLLDPTTTTTLPCGERAARSLEQRVASLRAGLDALRAAVPMEDPLQVPVHGVAEQFEYLARDVRALVEWSLPAPVRALDCTLEEIGLSALDSLRSDHRALTLVAVERPTTRVRIDGSLVSRCLARVLEHGFTRGAGHAGIQIAPRATGFIAMTSFEGDGVHEDSVSASICEPLARRDLSRLGARFELDSRGFGASVEFFDEHARAGGTL